MATDTIRLLSLCFQLLLMLTFSEKVCGYLRVEQIESSKINVKPINEKIYDVSMEENNHSWNGTETPLFYIVTNGTLALDNAIDFTEGNFKYNLKNNSGKIIMNADQYFDYETQARKYSFRISGTEGFIIVDFYIINIDDENPSLTSPQCEMEERKKYNATNSPCYCTLSDPDGWLSKTTFTLWAVGNSDKDKDIRDTFDIVFRERPNDTTYTTTVYVILHEELDFEKKMVRIFDIEAHDSANHSTTPPKVRALVNVKNVRHSKPVWSRPITSATVTEKSRQTIEVAARDGDIGISSPVFYEITSQDLPDEKYIELVDNTRGVIRINNIDRDKYDLTTFNFSMKAYVKDNGGPWETGLNTTLFVTDIDDNPPLFRRMVNTTDPNKVVIFKDTDEKTLIISFLENYNQSFHIDLFIQDIDTGENAQFDVKLVNTNETFRFTDAFMIIPNKGYRNGIFDISVQDKRNLDYENPDWRSLSFEVHVTGTKNNTKTDKLYVDVNLIDYNDEIPTFSQPEYTISINETAPKGFKIIQVEATDRDAEDITLRHELIGTANVLKLLDIEPETGWISVKVDNAFDYDKLNPIFVQVRATDKVNHKTSVPVSIKLLDVNNKAPIITNDDVIEVEENQPTSMKLSATIRATDPDTKPKLEAKIDWEASYATKNAIRLNMSDEEIAKRVKFLDIYSNQDPTDPDKKQIIVSLTISKENQDKTTPDYELFDVLHLSIVVTDLLTDPAFPAKKSTTTSVMITIVDIIDNTPYFPEYLPNGLPKPINRTVLEGADKGTTVGNLRAYDLDIRAKLSYKCNADEENFDWITVDAPSGDMVVKDGAYIDADTNKTYYFNYTCYANDSIHESEALNVKIYILDTNNKIPVLTNLADNTQLKLEEKSHKDTHVFKIDYHDEDRDDRFHTVRCSIIEGTNDNTRKCSDEFYIRDNEIKVKFGDDHLNRDEGDKYYNCTAECKDNPDKDDERQNKVPVIFSIILLDINDHDPILIEPKADELQKGIHVSENYKKGATLFNLKGLDIDEGLNGTIVFDITDSNGSNLKLFKVNQIDDKNAEIQAGEDLKDHYGKYDVSFSLHDKGTPPRSSHNETTIEITRFNYEQPRFIYPADGTQEILFSDQALDAPLYRFNQSETLPDFYASDSKGTQTCTKWDITMEMEQVTPKDYPTMFRLKRIDKCKYQLQINERYKKEDAVSNRFNIKLTARVKEGKEMTGEAPYTVTTSLLLTFTDNNQQPTFEKSTWTFTLTEADQNQHSKLGVGAHYPGNIDRPIFYYIVNDPQNNPALEYFKVNVNTGEITLKKELEYLKYKKYSFQIIASNDTNPSTSTNPLSKLNVICNVEEINRYPPVFKNPVFYGALLTTSQKGAVLVTLKATDRDEIDQNHLTYQILGDIENESSMKNIKDPFKLDSTSGDISLNFSVDGGMSGYFTFQVMVQDKQDKYKNGPHNDTASTIIFIITPEFTTRFRFMNSMDQVRENEEQMLDVIKGILGFEPNIQAKGTDDHNQAFVNLYFIESKDKLMGGRGGNHLGVDVVKGSVIQRKVGDIGTYQKLYQELYTRAKLTLLSFPSDSTTDDLETTVRNWLIGVSVILGVLCLGLAAAFLFKMRQLKNTISRLTDRRFSDVGEKMDIAAPNTNKHAIEGSNPIFTSDVAKAPKDSNDFEIGDFDRKSVVSGDSDLIGVEDNPEFDLAFSEGINEAKNYI